MRAIRGIGVCLSTNCRRVDQSKIESLKPYNRKISILGANFRPIQPLNGRTIRTNIFLSPTSDPYSANQVLNYFSIIFLTFPVGF